MSVSIVERHGPLSIGKVRAIAVLTIVAAMLLVYKDALLADYYFADDASVYPSYFFTPPDMERFLMWGRPLADILLNVSVLFSIPFKSTQGAHLITIAALCGLLWVIFISLQQTFGAVWSLATTLVIGCLPSMQVHITYGRIFSYTIGYILAYVAVSLVTRDRARLVGWLSFVLLTVAEYHIFQSVPFFSLVFLLVWIMSTDASAWRATLTRTCLVILVLAATVATCAIAYKLTVEFSASAAVYKKAYLPLAILSGDAGGLASLELRKSLNVFELWSYIVPVEAFSERTRAVIYGVAGLAFWALPVVRTFVGGKQPKDLLVLLAGLIFFVASMLPVAMDGFGPRQHLYPAPQTILVLMVFWSLRGLRLPDFAVLAIAGLAVVAAAVAFPVKLVFPEAFSAAYVRDLISSVPDDGKPIRIVVSDYGRKKRCRYEPCTGFYSRGHASIIKGQSFYETIGAQESRKIRSVDIVDGRDFRERLENAEAGRGHVIAIRVKDVAAAYAKTYRY